MRRRKLLLHRQEIRKLIGKTVEKGMTLVPTRMYFKNGHVKVAISLAKGKKAHDKRETIKRRSGRATVKRRSAPVKERRGLGRLHAYGRFMRFFWREMGLMKGNRSLFIVVGVVAVLIAGLVVLLAGRQFGRDFADRTVRHRRQTTERSRSYSLSRTSRSTARPRKPSRSSHRSVRASSSRPGFPTMGGWEFRWRSSRTRGRRRATAFGSMALVSDGRASDELFIQDVDPFLNQTDRRWIPVMVDLSAYAGEEVDVILNTYGSTQASPALTCATTWRSGDAPEIVIVRVAASHGRLSAERDDGPSIVPLLDLEAQYRPIRDEVLAAVTRVCDSQRFIQGPEVEALERELAARSRASASAIAVSSGTDALLVAMMALGIGAGRRSHHQHLLVLRDRRLRRPSRRHAAARRHRSARRAILDPAAVRRRCAAHPRDDSRFTCTGSAPTWIRCSPWPPAAGSPVIEDACQAIGATYQGRQAGSHRHGWLLLVLPQQESRRLRRRRSGHHRPTPDSRTRSACCAITAAEPKYDHHSGIGGNSGSTLCRPRSCG